MQAELLFDHSKRMLHPRTHFRVQVFQCLPQLLDRTFRQLLQDAARVRRSPR
jgi:hypothetical protein